MKRLFKIIIVIGLLSLVPYSGFSGNMSYPYGSPVKDQLKDIIPHRKYGEEDVPKGIKTKITVKYDIKSGQKVLTSKWIEKYDESGRLIETQTHHKPSKVSSKGSSRKRIYQYDDKPKQMTVLRYDLTDNSLDEKGIYKYDDKGNQIEQVLYDADGNLGLKHTYKYDQAGNITEDSLAIQGILVSKGASKYDAKGNLIEAISYTGDGTIFYKYTIKYDDKGNEVEVTSYTPNGNALIKKGSWENKYDAMGNLVETTGHDEDGCLNSKDTFKYDDKGNQIESCHYDKKGKLKSKETSKYDDKRNLIEYCDYDEKGRWTKKQTYKYDNKGNLTEETCIYRGKSKYSLDTQTVYEYEFYPEAKEDK